MTSFRQLLLLLFLLAQTFSGKAHHHGHGAPTTNQVRIWRHPNQRIAAEGRFLLLKNGRVHITTANDDVVTLALSELSWVDNNYVSRKVAQLEQLNQTQAQAPAIPDSDTGSIANGLVLVGLLALALLAYGTSATRRPMSGVALAGLSCLFVGMLACKKELVAVVTATSTDPSTIDAAFAPYKPGVATRWDNTYFYVESTGIPAHSMMTGITNWQQQVPVPQAYTGSNAWSIPLAPQLAASPLSTKTNFMKGAIALAVNGVPIFNPLNNRGEDSYLIGELDQWGGHCGKADDYHYHIPPLHLQATSGNLPIAYALDGYAVYTTKEPDGTAMLPLDDYHGHTGTNGAYHYHGTTTYPYLTGAMRGVVALDPATPAPENQILPQAMAKPLRPALTPLAGAKITSFSATGTTAYALQYQINTKPGYIAYSWDAGSKYTFVFTDVNGNKTTQTYQK
jgi:YHYH protein/SLA1 homology domain 1, SHD1